MPYYKFSNKFSQYALVEFIVKYTELGVCEAFDYLEIEDANNYESI